MAYCIQDDLEMDDLLKMTNTWIKKLKDQIM